MGNQNQNLKPGENVQEIKEVKEVIYGGPRDSRSKNYIVVGPRDSNSFYQNKTTYKVNQIEQSNRYFTQAGNYGQGQGQGSVVYYQVNQYNTTGGPQDTLRKTKYSGYGDGRYYAVQQRYGIDMGPNYYQPKKYYTSNVEVIPVHMNYEASSVDRAREGRNQIKKTEVYNITDYGDYEEIPAMYYRQGYGTVGRPINTINIGGGGIEGGFYRFEGEKVELREEDDYLRGNVVIDEEEIIQEINRRKRKTAPGKKTYELLDKFYAVTEVDAKSVRRRLKEEQYEDERRFQVHTTGNKAFGYGTGYSESQMQMRGQREGGYSQMQKVGGQREGGYRYEYSSESQMRGHGGKWYKNLSYGVSSSKNKFYYPIDNFSKYIFEQINKIRTNPQSFIGAIEDSKANIARDRHGRLIYKSKVKVALTDGESAFDEAIRFLNNAKPMEKLTFSSEITVDPPQYESEIKDRNDLRRKVEYMTENGINIRAFWRDIIKDPEISFLLMIVDDTGARNGLKRKDILDPDMKYIGISSAEINGKFVCYMTFSPEL